MANFISIFHNIHGHSNTICTLSCSSIQAVGYACKLIEKGEVDIVIAGGGDSWLNPYGLNTYRQLEPYSSSVEPQKACRPFDRRRSGIVLGEGAACIVLESCELAMARKANTYAEVKSWSSDYSQSLSSDALTMSITSALKQAAFKPEDLDAVVAHGSSSKVLDYFESKALAKVFNALPDPAPVFSVMPFCGHLVAGSGAIQILAGALSLNRGVLFGVPGFSKPDPECSVVVARRTDSYFLENILVSSINYDGSSAALIMSKCSL